MSDDAVSFAMDAQRNVGTVADKLVALAGKLRIEAQGFDDPTSLAGATAVAADVISTFTTGIGGLSSHLWCAVHNAGLSDARRANTTTQGGPS